MSGEISQVRMASFLTALAMREATADEIVGAARAMRAPCTRSRRRRARSICAARVATATARSMSRRRGVRGRGLRRAVAKHGNRNMSSRTGAADVLEALGVKIDLDARAAEAACAKPISVFCSRKPFTRR
jgi:anthranilate phosphoribosyltransferase